MMLDKFNKEFFEVRNSILSLKPDIEEGEQTKYLVFTKEQMMELVQEMGFVADDTYNKENKSKKQANQLFNHLKSGGTDKRAERVYVE